MRGESLDVIVLAGGGGSRLGGVTKADLVLGGRRLLDHILTDLDRWDHAIGRIVVVAPDTVAVPPGIHRTLEDPPGGGPAAGVAAALALLGSGDIVALLPCDAPRAARALPALLADLGPDGAAVRNAAGFTEYLLGVYRFESLARRVRDLDGARDISARRLFGPLALTVVDSADADRDVDTWDDLAALDL